MGKKVTKMLLLIMAIIIIAYLFMLRGTNSIVEDFNNIVSGNKIVDVDYGALKKYDYSKYFHVNSASDVTLERSFVIHNFKKGYMNVNRTSKNVQQKKGTSYGIV